MNKSELMDGLQEEYRNWQGLLDLIGPEQMDHPGVTGHWSIKDIVAHLTGWRRRTVSHLQAAQRGEAEPSPPWPAHLQTDDEINAWIYESNHTRSVGEVLNDSHEIFEQLLAAIEGLPDKAFVDVQHYLPWWEGDTLNPAAFFAHFHEEHEPDMRAWLARVENQ